MNRKTNLLLSAAGLSAALGLLASLAAPARTGAFVLSGDELGIGQRDFRVFNNFSDASANNNTTPDPDFPGATGAVQAIWKGHLEWGSERYMLVGDQDPQQAAPGGLGDGGANFESKYEGQASNFGGFDSNIHEEELDNNPGGTLAYTIGPTSNGWLIRYLSAWIWQDGPGSNGSTDLQGVACHEIGHALGLSHSSNSNATMFFAISGSGVAARSIHSDDIAGVQAIYGVKAGNKPLITSLAGSNSIGGTLTIFGTDFSATGNVIWFTKANSNGESTKVSNVSSTLGGTRIDVAIPAGVADGSVAVKAEFTGASALSNEWPLDIGGTIGDPPSVTSIDPDFGPEGGFTEVTIGGSGFTGTTSVEFDGVDALSFTVDSATQITAVTPPMPLFSLVDVTVTDNDGSSTLADGYAYTFNQTPNISQASPDSGPALGGTTVTITGSNVVGATSVTFGGVAGTNVVVLDANTLEVDTPAGLGTVDVVVFNNAGSDTLVGGFSYVPAGNFVNIGPSNLPGQFGEPVLAGSGDLTPGAGPGYTLTVTDAQPLDLAFFFLSVEPTTPVNGFFGGTFYPLPILFQTILGTDGSGSMVLPTAIPGGTPSGLQLVIQIFFEDSFAPAGVSGTNGLRLEIP